MNIQPPYGYQAIVPLAKTHQVRLQAGREVAPALRGLGVLPLSFGEFAAAQRDYPITFISGDQGRSFMAMALVGVEPGRNLFVGEAGTWAEGHYLPAYVRRHPFCMARVAAEGQAQEQRIACVESSAIAGDGTALFDAGGEALPAWQALSRLLVEFENDLTRTAAMTQRLAALQLLEPFNAQVSGGSPITLTGMYRVAEEKLQALPGDTLQGLARDGVLARCYLHLASLANFRRLLDRRAAAGAGAAPAPAMN